MIPAYLSRGDRRSVDARLGCMVNQGWVYREQVERNHAGLSLLAYYSQRYRHSSEAEWQARIEQGQILVNAQPAWVDTRLELGQELTYDRPPWQEPAVPLGWENIYADPDLRIVAKPAGLPVLPGGGFLQHTLLWQLQQQYPQETPVPIHRLGRGTSGLMILAVSDLAKSNLSQQMRDHRIRKTYRALVGVTQLPDQFTINQPIGKIPHPQLGYIYGACPEGKFAWSECQVLKRYPQTTLIEVRILTGRPHQIRIHLASIGYPLVGDPLYLCGGKPQSTPSSTAKLTVPGDCGYHLHAHRLAFFHPRTQEPLEFISPAPKELA
jgi:23S rRNA pseudouridine1911/1915/1917 synthase